MTRKPWPRPPSPDSYRAGYLKLKSVLYDRTTGMPAFPVLFDELRTLLDTRPELGVIHLEIANLETVESLYGWQVFDRIVAHVADVLRDAVGRELPVGSLLAVNGVAGDRFVVFVSDREAEAKIDGPFLSEAGTRLCRKLESMFEQDAFAGLNPKLCFRAGHAMLSENPFFRFERCVYTAVEQARGSHARRERRRDLSWGEELQKIIQGAAVETLFQPVVELESRAVLGHEAFTRGPRESLFEAPRAMFALSTRLGLSAELDRLCFDTALEASARLVGEGKLFVNVLPGSLDDARWRAEHLQPLLETLALKPTDLVLEVSERLAGADPDPFVASIARVRGDGFGLALDDVGTGRAGMGAVEKLRPDYLKLDTSLVRNIDESWIGQDVLTTIATLAERIDAAVIAEGVESETERRALISGGARYGQGYLFGAPAQPGPARAARRTDTTRKPAARRSSDADREKGEA